jgi:hypothetical protein
MGRASVSVEDLDQLLLYRDSAILAAFAADVDYAALVSRADVTNIGAEQLRSWITAVIHD